MKSDAEIMDDVINELHWNPQVTEPEAIGVAVRDGAVTLTGHVPSYAEKLAAARAAERVYGVKAVANDLKVQLSRAPRDDSDVARARALDAGGGRRPGGVGRDEHRADRHLEDGVPRYRAEPTASRVAIVRPRLHQVNPARSARAMASSTPVTTAATRCTALRSVWYRLTCTPGSSVSGARMGWAAPGSGSGSATRWAKTAVTDSRAMVSAVD
jgi:hypothetical protein